MEHAEHLNVMQISTSVSNERAYCDISLAALMEIGQGSNGTKRSTVSKP